MLRQHLDEKKNGSQIKHEKLLGSLGISTLGLPLTTHWCFVSLITSSIREPPLLLCP